MCYFDLKHARTCPNMYSHVMLFLEVLIDTVFLNVTKKIDDFKLLTTTLGLNYIQDVLPFKTSYTDDVDMCFYILRVSTINDMYSYEYISLCILCMLYMYSTYIPHSLV